jgi:glycosyltransferase involved in cell wall biosynthesis
MGNKTLKILFLPKWYPNRFDILDGVFIVDHAKAAALNHDVLLLFVHSDFELSVPKKIIINNSNGYTEMIVYFRYKKTGISFLDKIIIGIRYLMVQFESYNQIKKKWGTPDIIHIHILLRSSFLALWLNMRRGIPYIISEQWTGYDQKIRPRINRIKKIFLAYVIKRSDVVTTISYYLSDNMKKICDKTRYEVLSNTVDENLFRIQPKEPSIKKKFIHISTLNNHQKNFSEILRAIAKVSEQRTDFELHIIGKGVEKQKQIELAMELKILERIVFFHGYLPKEKVADRIAKSDLMILFSNYETQSCVLLESFLCGVPVIAPNIGGVNEIVNNKNGILVSPNNTDMLCEVILSFLSSKVKFDAQEIGNKALIYSYNAMSKRMSELYQSVKINSQWAE